MLVQGDAIFDNLLFVRGLASRAFLRNTRAAFPTGGLISAKMLDTE